MSVIKKSTHENVDEEEDPGSNVRRDDVPLHAVDVGQFAEKAEPVVNQRRHPTSLLRHFAKSETANGL